jgi:hypothetical protein
MRIDRTVRGRPGRLGRDCSAWRRASRSRCQRRTVSRPDDQVQVREYAPGQLVQQRCEQGSIARGEPHPVRTELPLQDRELVAQGEYFGVLVPIAHRQQPQQGERVAHSEIGQSQQHDRSPWHSTGEPSGRSAVRYPAQHQPTSGNGFDQRGQGNRQAQGGFGGRLRGREHRVLYRTVLCGSNSSVLISPIVRSCCQVAAGAVSGLTAFEPARCPARGTAARAPGRAWSGAPGARGRRAAESS